MDCLEDAIALAGMGWRILPVNGKKPALKAWPEKATANPDTLRKWIKPGLNIGLATGEGSGVVALDIDPRNGGADSLQRLINELGPLPETITSNTGGGGNHYLFQYQPGLKSSKPIAGIDFQSDGKMIVLPSSMHPETGALYEWHNHPSTTPLATLPADWYTYLAGNNKPSQIDTQALTGPFAEGVRNDSLYRLGCQWRRDGMSASKIEVKLAEVNVLECLPPLDTGEIENIAKQVMRCRVTSKSLKTQWQELIFQEPFPAAMKATLMALSLFADADGKSCFPNEEQIAVLSSVSPKTVRKHLTTAEDQGWLTIYHHSRKGKPGYSKGYVLTLSPVVATDLAA